MADTTTATGLLATATPAPDPQQYRQFIQAATPEATPPAPTVTPTVAAPTAVQGVTAPTPNAARDLTAKETVAGQLNDLLNQNSAYMQNAQSNANAAMNARGLINSSLAAGATQKAAIESALPIAQQDATANANSGQLAQQGNQDIKLTGYNAQLGSAQAQENAGYRAAENAQNIQANKELQSQKAADDSRLRAQADAASYKLEMDKMTQTTGLDMAKLDQADRARVTETIGTMTQQLTDAVGKINATPTSQLSTSDKKAAIEQLYANYRDQVNMLASISGFTIDWNGGGGSAPAATQPSGYVNPAANSASGLERLALSVPPKYADAGARALATKYGWMPTENGESWVKSS